MRIKLLLALCLALTGCAVPVRLIGNVVQTKPGTYHFEPLPDEEPHLPDGLVEGFSMILRGLGPWGDIAASLLAAGGIAAPAVVVHRHHKKKKAKKQDDPPKVA
jgi:hypothetical protein